MPALHIRNVPDETVAALKRRAAARGRSLEAELREILDAEAAKPQLRRRRRPLDRSLLVNSGNAGMVTRDEIYGDDDPNGR